MKRKQNTVNMVLLAVSLVGASLMCALLPGCASISQVRPEQASCQLQAIRDASQLLDPAWDELQSVKAHGLAGVKDLESTFELVSAAMRVRECYRRNELKTENLDSCANATVLE